MKAPRARCSQCDGWGFWYPVFPGPEPDWHMAVRVTPEEGEAASPGFLTRLSMREPTPLRCPECGGTPGCRSPFTNRA